jgi:hypothetical protein
VFCRGESRRTSITKVGLSPHQAGGTFGYLTTAGGGLAMGDGARFRKQKGILFALAVLCARVACAAPISGGQPRLDCKVYEQQEEAKLEAQRRDDPSIQAERLDTVFYSAKRNSCLASVFFVKRDATYGAILDIVEGRMLWVKSYKGTRFGPAQIVEMDEQMDDAIKALEFATESSGNSHSFNFLPLLLDRTMNTFPAIKNALTEGR